MKFHSPEWLWLIPFIALIPFVWRWLESSAEKKLARFASRELLQTLVKRADARKKKMKVAFGTLSLVCAAAALARPQMGTSEEVLQSEGLDMVFLLDVSNSMLAEDIVPNRLKKAKHMIRGFVDRLSGDRVGVVAFAGSAYPAVPLTTDYEFLKQSLEVLDETVVSNQGSDLSKALGVGVEFLSRGGVNDDASGSRVIIILSDGEAHDESAAETIAKLKKMGVQAFSIGVGSLKGGPIPIRDGGGFLRGYKKDSLGNIIHTKLESSVLESIASKTGGKYYAASSNEGEIEEILGLLSSAERAMGENRRVIVYDEMFQYPLALAVIFLLTALLSSERRARTTKVAAAGAVLFLGMAFVQPHEAAAANSLREYRYTKEGTKAYEEKDYAGAAQSFGKAQALDPDSSALRLNLGDALLKSGSPEAAIPEFQEAAKSKDINAAARGSYNLGRAYEMQKNYEQALQAYQQGLARLAENPKEANPEVVQRLKRALEATEEQKKQQKQEGQSKEKDKDGKSKEDQNKDQQNKDQPKQHVIPKQKPQFKPEKLNENDAKRILQQLKEGEKKSQQNMIQKKTERPKDEKPSKDW